MWTTCGYGTVNWKVDTSVMTATEGQVPPGHYLFDLCFNNEKYLLLQMHGTNQLGGIFYSGPKSSICLRKHMEIDKTQAKKRKETENADVTFPGNTQTWWMQVEHMHHISCMCTSCLILFLSIGQQVARLLWWKWCVCVWMMENFAISWAAAACVIMQYMTHCSSAFFS